MKHTALYDSDDIINIIVDYGQSQGYYDALFEKEKVEGYVDINFEQTEFVKCVTIQLIGYISKNNSLKYEDVLKYIDSYSKPTLNNAESDADLSFYNGLKILVDQDQVLWGNNNSRIIDCSKKYEETYSLGSNEDMLSEKSFFSRSELVNLKYTASPMEEKKRLKFKLNLKHKSNNLSIPLPSSYENDKYQMQYFLYATIYRDKKDSNITCFKKLRVYQNINIDLDSYLRPLDIFERWKFSEEENEYIEMGFRVPKNGFTHREIIPLSVDIDNYTKDKIVEGFIVGLYEITSIKDSSKKFTEYDFKLLFERFYRVQIKPDSSISTKLHFPLIDGNCFIRKKNKTIDGKEYDNTGDTEEVFQLVNADIPVISASVNERSRWPILVNHRLRITTVIKENINNEELNETKEKNEETINNIPLSSLENDTNTSTPTYSTLSLNTIKYKNENNLYVSPLDSDNLVNLSTIENNNNNNNNNNNQSLDHMNTNNDNSNKNKKYGILLGHLCNEKVPLLFESERKKVDINIIIGTVTKSKRECGNELYLNEVFEDQYYTLISNCPEYEDELLRKNNLSDSLYFSNVNDNPTTTTSHKRKVKKNISHHPITTKVSPIYEAILSSSICPSPTTYQEETFSPVDDDILFCNTLNGESSPIITVAPEPLLFDTRNKPKDEPNVNRKLSTLSISSVNNSNTNINNNMVTTPTPNTNLMTPPKPNKGVYNHPQSSKVSPIYEATLSSSIDM